MEAVDVCDDAARVPAVALDATHAPCASVYMPARRLADDIARSFRDADDLRRQLRVDVPRMRPSLDGRCCADARALERGGAGELEPFCTPAIRVRASAACAAHALPNVFSVA